MRPAAKSADTRLRFFVTKASTACEMASYPAMAVTPDGAVMVSAGSRIATLNAAPGSPQAIFAWVSASEMIA